MPLADFMVAPYAGAWIETFLSRSISSSASSPLMQGRGLKPGIGGVKVYPVWASPLMQGRGLKPNFPRDLIFFACRPLCRGVD